MRILNRLPVRFKLALVIFLSNFILILFVCTILLYWDLNTIKRSTIERAKSEIGILNQSFTKIIVLDSPHFAADVISSLRNLENLKNLILFDLAGNAKLRYDRYSAIGLPSNDSLPSIPQFKKDGLYMTSNVNYDGSKYGVAYFHFSTELLNEKISNSIQSAIYLFFIALMVSIALSYWFQRLFSKPIVHLAEVLTEVTHQKNFDIIVETDEANEIGLLYDNFNQMIRELRQFHSELINNNTELEKHRNRLESLVQQRTRKLKRYTDELESFSYSVSHDLRSPLRAINGYCSLLLEDCGATLDDQASEYLNKIAASTKRMGDLIDDLLTLSRITRFEVKMDFIDFSSLCRSIVADINNDGLSHIAFDIQADMVVFGDEKLLRIMMENLINNAAKYSQYRPQPKVGISLKENDEQRIISISDNGVGFDTRYAEKLFKPFQRLHASEKFEGTGIGLTIVQRIAERHGGRVWATSKTAVGSTFFTSLPKLAVPVERKDNLVALS